MLALVPRGQVGSGADALHLPSCGSGSLAVEFGKAWVSKPICAATECSFFHGSGDACKRMFRCGSLVRPCPYDNVACGLPPLGAPQHDKLQRSGIALECLLMPRLVSTWLSVPTDGSLRPKDHLPSRHNSSDRAAASEGRKARPRDASVARLVWALLLLTAIKGCFWAAVFPPLQPSDEVHHIGYSRDIVRHGTLGVDARDFFTPEEVVAMEMARLVEISGYRQPLDLSPRRVQEIEEARLLLKNPADQPPAAPSLWVTFFSRYHPPLYYAVGAVLEMIAKPSDLLEHLALGRLLSVLFSVGTVGLTYLLAREVYPTRPGLCLAAATTVSFLPMVTYLGSVYTNQALETMLFTALFWMLARVIRRTLDWLAALWLGILLGIGLLTKVSFLVAIPLVILVACYSLWKEKRDRAAWILVLLLPTILAGWWYLQYMQLGDWGLADRREAALGCAPLLTYLTNLPIRHLLIRLWGESVASFGHRDSLLPPQINMVTLSSAGLAIVGWGRQAYCVAARKRSTEHDLLTGQQWFTAGILFLAWIGIYVFYLLIGYFVSCDQRAEFLQGRQATSVAPGFCLLLLGGWLGLQRRHWRRLLVLVVLLCVALNSYSLIDRVILRYYGSQQEWAVDSRDELSAPIGTGNELVQCLVIDGLRINRLDLWLQKEHSSVAGELTLRLADGGGRTLLEMVSANVGWVATYPVYFQFSPVSVGERLCLTFAGEFDGEVRAWATASSPAGSWSDGADNRQGSLALRLYVPVPWRLIPDRMAVQSVSTYTSLFYRVLGLVYSFCLIVYSFLLFRWLLQLSDREAM